MHLGQDVNISVRTKNFWIYWSFTYIDVKRFWIGYRHVRSFGLLWFLLVVSCINHTHSICLRIAEAATNRMLLSTRLTKQSLTGKMLSASVVLSQAEQARRWNRAETTECTDSKFIHDNQLLISHLRYMATHRSTTHHTYLVGAAVLYSM